MITYETNSTISLHNSIPDDISLQVIDVCLLGSCSRFWREFCESDCVWGALCKDRWLAIVLDENSESQFHEIDREMDSNLKVESVMEALVLNQISEKRVCVKWWKLGRWFHGFRLRDELHSRNISLQDLSQRTEVLQRGVIHEVIRVQISKAKPAHTSWSFQVAQNVNI